MQLSRSVNRGDFGANGKPDDVTYTVTADMVEAKMKEKLQQPKYAAYDRGTRQLTGSRIAHRSDRPAASTSSQPLVR